jgi:hypothetical protein
VSGLVLVLAIWLGGIAAVLGLLGAIQVWEWWLARRAARRYDRLFAEQAGVDLQHTAQPRFLGARER